MSVAPVYIYGLVDPRSGLLRYVGKSNNPSWRLSQHIHPKLSNKTPVAQWCRSLVRGGFMPRIEVIEEVPENLEWQEVERFWIGYLRFIGCNLLNLADGGDEPKQTLGQRQAAGRAAAVAREKNPYQKMARQMWNVSLKPLRNAVDRGTYPAWRYNGLVFKVRAAAAIAPDKFGMLLRVAYATDRPRQAGSKKVML